MKKSRKLKNASYLSHKQWMWNPTWITSHHCFFSPSSSPFHSIGSLFTFQLLKYCFCFRVTLQSYFPLIDFLHFVLSPQTYSFPWHMIFTELSVYLFTSMNQDLYTSLTKTSSYTTFRNDRKILAYKLSLRFCLWYFLFTLKI